MSKLSDVIKNDVVKRAIYDKLVEKVDNTDASGFISEAKCTADKSELEKKFLIGECLDYENCKCRKSLVDRLVEECTENGSVTDKNNFSSA